MGLVPQRNFSRGLFTAADIFLQPPTTVPRLKNMLLNTKGSLLGASPGTGDFGHLLPGGRSFSLDVAQLVTPPNVTFCSLQYDPTSHLGAPALPTLTGVNVGGGTLVPGTTYTYQITAKDHQSFGGESIPTASVAIVLPPAMNAVQITFAASEAVAFGVYGRIAGLLGLLNGNVQAATFTDNGTIAPGAAPPVADTTKSVIFTRLDTDAILNKFTPDAMLTGVGAQQTGQTIHGGSTTSYPGAAWVNNVSPLAQLKAFGSKIILALGNNHPVYTWDGVAGAAVKLVNQFSAVYPNWIAATTTKVGDYILPAMNNPGAFVYICIQGGVTGGAAPGAFDQTTGGQTADNNVIWQNTGLTSNSPVPPGAAHVISYAGALVLGNTAPNNNGLDGPNVLAFSDVNNSSSWNPRNRVNVAKDDGQQISGMASFAIADTGILPTGGLVVFREYSTFIVFGFPPNTQVVQVQTDKGCIAPRTIQYIPGKGILRLTHLGWALFDGVNDTVLSIPINNVIVPVNTPTDNDLSKIISASAWFSKAALVSDPTMYLCAVPTGGAFAGLNTIYGYDPLGGGWMQFDAATFAAVGATSGILSVLKTPDVQMTTNTYGTPRLLAWAITADYAGAFVNTLLPIATGVGIAWSFRTPLAFKSESSRVMFKWLTVRGIAWSATPINITATPILDGLAQTAQALNPTLLDSTATAPFVFTVMVPIMQTGFNCQVDIVGDRGCEITGLEWETEDASEGVPPRLY